MTQLLRHATNGDRTALDALATALYEDLRRLAGRYMQGERPDHTFQPTALVHEAFVRLIDQREVLWRDRAQFFALASRMMRRILVDHARSKGADKRGGDHRRLTIHAVDQATPRPDIDLVALDEAMERLASLSELQARIVELRFFGGLTIDETAQVLDIGKRSVDREWACAKAWLYRELGD
jgi:RNA polymerase sigma factor (TIGR02999 family)